MNIKKIMRKNFLAVLALALTAGSALFMSFESSKNSSAEVLYWFAVDAEGNISETHTGNPDSSCPVIPPNEYCEVAFDTPTPPVSNMSETTIENGSQPVSEIRYKP